MGKETMVKKERIFTTKRLILRPWFESDAESLYKYAKDPEVGLPAGWPVHKSVAESLEVIQNVLNSRECYAICEKDTNEVIGSIELKLEGHTDMTERDDECELGYWLNKEYVGKGYMTEAAKAVAKFLFNDVNYRKIIAGCDSENIGSARVMEKVGMKREAVLREQIKRKDDTWGDDFQYGILRREFEEK